MRLGWTPILAVDILPEHGRGISDVIGRERREQHEQRRPVCSRRSGGGGRRRSRGCTGGNDHKKAGQLLVPNWLDSAGVVSARCLTDHLLRQKVFRVCQRRLL
ncbi:hypothetical protein MTO96_040682 [Rhipicephalus appendiculatus]